MSKKFFIILLVLVAVASPIFAAETEIKQGSLKLDLSFVKRAVTVAVGFVGGAYVLWKLASGVLGAIKDQDHDQGALKRVIGTAILNIIILSSFLFLVNYVFTSGDGSNTASVDNFFSGLTGAFVSI